MISTPHVRAMLAEAIELAELAESMQMAGVDFPVNVDGLELPVSVVLERAANLARHAAAELDDDRLRHLHGFTGP